MESERSNLLALSRLVVRDVINCTQTKQLVTIDESISYQKQAVEQKDEAIDATNRLLTVVEHCLCHGLRQDVSVNEPVVNSMEPALAKDILKTTSNVLRRARDQVVSTANNLIRQHTSVNPWSVLLHIEQLAALAEPISRNILLMGGLHTGLGRSRVWLRQALMQKQLGEYFKFLIDENNSLSPDNSCNLEDNRSINSNLSNGSVDSVSFSMFYYPEAMMLNDEGVVFTGLLASLKFIDFCFILKDDLVNLDQPLQVLPYHFYLDNNLDKFERIFSKEILFSTPNLSSVIDQKNFLEDLCNNLRKRLDQTNSTNQQLKEKINQLTANMNSLNLENQSLNIMLNQFKKVKLDTVNENFVSINELNKRIEDLESQLKSSHQINEEKSELIESLRTHLTETNARTQQLTRHLSESQSAIKHKQTLIKQLEAKSKGMGNIIDQMKERIANLGNEKVALERNLVHFKQKISEYESDLIKQKEKFEIQTNQLRKTEIELNEKNAELDRLKGVSSELNEHKTLNKELEMKLANLRSKCEEQERSLGEMADVVNSCKLEAESLRESHMAFKDAQWATDAANPNCALCQTAFSVSRRRHHCRNCGLIFCHDCSTQKMLLPSSAKPVRVCDSCHGLLLNRYNSKPI